MPESADPQWKVYEKIAAQIYKTLSPEAKVTHNDKIYGHDSKNNRQIDISIRQNVGPHNMLIIVQCRDHATKMDVNHVGELMSVIKDVKANMGILVSNSGFTQGAINFARENGVQLCSLYDAQNENWKDLIKIPILCHLTSATQMRGRFKFGVSGKSVPSNPYKMEFVKQSGEIKSFMELFADEWNEKRNAVTAGECTFPCSEQGLRIRATDGSLIPIDLNFIVKIHEEYRFGYLGISDSQGVINVVDQTYTTTEITTDDLDTQDVFSNWRLLKSRDETPQTPLIEINAFTRISPKFPLT